MYNSDTEMIFPLRVVPALADLRGEEWSQLVARVASPGAERHEQVAFVLMMARMSSCGGCAADSFRAMRGCTQCARQSIRRFRGSDKDILAMFQQYLNEVAQFEEKHRNNGRDG